MSEGPLSPEEIAHRGFGTAFRGFDTGEVRTYLQRVANELRASVARERELHRRLADAEHRAAHPVIEGENLTRVLGEEMGRILANAQEAANELRTRAEENAARILREAHEQAQRIRAQAEVILADRTEEAEAEAAQLREAAAAEAAAVVERGRQQAAAVMADVETRARQLVHDAQAARGRVLGDLTRRRHLLHAQVEQLRAGRARLLEAYRVVRRTLDEVADELQRVEGEAREAAGAAGERLAAGVEIAVHEGDELDEILAAFPEDAEEVDGPEQAPEPGPPDQPAAMPAGPREGAALAPPDATVELEIAAPRPAPALRVVGPPPDEGPQLDVVEPPSDVEAVRVIAAEPGPPPPAPAAGSPSPPEAGAPAPSPAADAPKVDELFARIRAARAEAVARAHSVLDAGAAGPPAAEPAAPAEAAGPPAAGAPPPAAALPSPPPEAPGGGPASPERVLERRDSAVEDIEPRLARKLKRALQDEQNEVLDRLRSTRGRPAGVLPPPEEHPVRYRRAAAELLEGAAAAGVAFVSGPAGLRPEVDDVVDQLASALSEPLRRALERALGGDASGDASAVVERLGAVYRECKAQRIEGLAGDAVTAAFARGALAGLPPGSAARWVVDDDGRPCPDCDDNALAGPTPAGEAFPTGQTHPPAHAGCRCVLAPAEVHAHVAGG